MTQIDPIKSGFIPFDLLGPKLPSKYDDPSVPLPPLPDVRRTPLTADEVLVEEGWEDDQEWHETDGYYGRVVPRALWDKYRRLRAQLARMEGQMSKCERYTEAPIPTDEERRAALGRGSLLMPAFQPLRNRLSRP
jgi:hypothetical protein